MPLSSSFLLCSFAFIPFSNIVAALQQNAPGAKMHNSSTKKRVEEVQPKAGWI
jgi:hypothetical protein